MIILSKRLTMQEVAEINDFPNGFVKGVVDIEQELVALDADMHFMLSDYLKEMKGAKEADMWGFNLWLDAEEDEALEFDSYINIRNNQLHGYLRGGLDIKDAEIKAKATEVISKWIEL